MLSQDLLVIETDNPNFVVAMQVLVSMETCFHQKVLKVDLYRSGE